MPVHPFDQIIVLSADFPFQTDPENGVNQYIMSLQPQGDSLLVGTPSGVYSYLPRTESFRRHKEMKLQPTGRGDRLQSHDGRLWIGTWEEGLMLVGDGNKSTQVVSPLLHRLGNHIHKLYEYDDRYILMGCDEGLVAYDMDSGNIELWDTPKFVYAIAGDHEGGLWLGTFYDGVYYMNDATHRFDGVAGHVIARFCQDTDGRLWIASDDAGLCCLKNGVSVLISRCIDHVVSEHAIGNDGVVILILSNAVSYFIVPAHLSGCVHHGVVAGCAPSAVADAGITDHGNLVVCCRSLCQHCSR
jgi:ligand-binding sensor domain-containing protein